MSTQQMPERNHEWGRQPDQTIKDGDHSFAFLVTYGSYFVVAAVVITMIVLMTR